MYMDTFLLEDNYIHTTWTIMVRGSNSYNKQFFVTRPPSAHNRKMACWPQLWETISPEVLGLFAWKKVQWIGEEVLCSAVPLQKPIKALLKS